MLADSLCDCVMSPMLFKVYNNDKSHSERDICRVVFIIRVNTKAIQMKAIGL